MVIDATPYLVLCAVALAIAALTVAARAVIVRRHTPRKRVRHGLTRITTLCRRVELIDDVTPSSLDAW